MRKILILLVLSLFVVKGFSQQTTSQQFDNQARLTLIKYTNGSSITYTYDANGNRTQQLNSNTTLPIDLHWIGASINVDTIAAGNTIVASGNNFNAGTGMAGNHRIIAWLSSNNTLEVTDTRLDSLTVSSLASNSSFALNNWQLTIPSVTPQGNYYVILQTDARQNVSEANETNNLSINSLTVNSCSGISTNAVTTMPGCGLSNGSITLNITGGQAPFSYSINNGVSFTNANLFNNLNAGTYSCKVTDSRGCNTSLSVLLNSPTGTLPTPNFTYSINSQTITLVNTSANASAYSWDFGNGVTSNSNSPTYTYPSTGNYSVCLTATNSCGSAVECKNIALDSNQNLGAYPKVYFSNVGELDIKFISRSNLNDGWIITGGLNRNNFSGWYFTKCVVLKIDDNGRIVWKKDFASNFQNGSLINLVKFGTGYAIGITDQITASSTSICLFDDNGNGNNRIQLPMNDLYDIAAKGNNLYLLQGGTNALKLKLKKIDFTNLNAIAWQTEIDLVSGAQFASNFKLLATNDGGVVVGGTKSDAFPINGKYVFLFKYASSGQYGFAQKYYAGVNNWFNHFVEDNNSNIIVSNNYNINGVVNNYLFKINGTSGNVIYTGVNISNNAESIISVTENNEYFLLKNNYLIKTNQDFLVLESRKYFTPLNFNKITSDISRRSNFLLSSVSDIVNPRLESFNTIAPLFQNTILNYSCMTDSAKSITIDPVQVLQYPLNPTAQTTNDLFSSAITQGDFINILDSNFCAQSYCNTISIFSSSRQNICIGDTIVFSSTSQNASNLQWRVNNVNKGNGDTTMYVFASAGTYIVQLIASTGNCKDTLSRIFQINSGIQIAADITNAKCNQPSGNIQISPTGGTQPYSFAIEDGNYVASNTFSGLIPAQYTVRVQDANGCASNTSYIINNTSSPIQVKMDSLSITCNNPNSGGLSAVALNGVSPVKYLWSTGDTTSSVNNLSAGSYTLNIMDAIGCSFNQTFQLSDNSTRSIVRSAVARGFWNNSSTWEGGRVPGICDSVSILAGQIIDMDIDTTIRALYIAPTGILFVNSHGKTLNIGSPLYANANCIVNGTMNISLGTIKINGRLKAGAGSVFTMSGGSFILDGNSGNAMTSVSNGIHLFEAQNSMTNFAVNGGFFNIVDPPLGANSQAISCPYNFGDNSTLKFGDGISTTPSNNPDGFGGNLFPAQIGKFILDAKTLTGNRHFINKTPLSIKSPINILSGNLIQSASLSIRQ